MTLDISWEQYHHLIERLALLVHDSGWRFNQIICIARGGLRVGDVLSRIYEVPLAILSTHSYSAEGGTVRGQLVIAEHMTMTAPRLGELPQRFTHLVELRTAVLWYKAHSVFKPDYYVEYLADNPWIHQPFEVYDT